MTTRSIVWKAGLVFGGLLLLVVGISWFDVRRIDEADARMELVLKPSWGQAQLAAEALRYSNLNNRLTMSVFLEREPAQIEVLLAERAANTEKISQVVARLESSADSPRERELLAELESARRPYIEAYLKALDLLLKEHKADSARERMTGEVLPLLAKYHRAWENYVDFQGAQISDVASANQRQYTETRGLVFFLVATVSLAAAAIAIVVITTLHKEMALREQIEGSLRRAHDELEQRVRDRTAELAIVNRGLMEQIAERRQAEATLRENEEKFEKVFHAVPIAILISEIETGRMLDANEAFLRMAGYRLEEIVGRTTLEIGLIDPAFRRTMIATILAEGRFPSTEQPLVAKGGRSFDCIINGEIVEIGGSRRLLSIGVDVTEARRLEAQLRQAQKMEAVGQLAGGVAHDFNNILSAILLHLGLLREERDLGPEGRSTLDELEREASRAAALTQQLLVFSRRKAMHVKPVDLNALVANLLKMLSRILGEGISVDWQRTDDLPAVDCDAGMIEQVLTNLCVNARDAMPGGGRLILRTAAMTLDEGVARANPEARAGDFVRLSVIDTGIGMDETTRMRLFEPFFTTKEVGKGSGLGLATVYGIVKQHNGWIDVATAPGRGSTFHVFLPAHSEKAAAAGRNGPGSVRRGRGETVLIVEDEDAMRRVLAATLQRFGYRVIEACDGPDAFRKWDRHGDSVDLVISDMVMPEGASGSDVVKQLRAKRPSLRAIIISGYVPNQEMSALPNVPFLAKPFDIPELLGAVRECLDKAAPAFGKS